MRRWLLAAMLGFLMAGRAEAAFLTLDTPDMVLVRPLTGSITYTMTGSASFDVGYTAFAREDLYYPNRYPDATTVQYLTGSYLGFPTAAYNGGVYTGSLFTITVSSTSALGLYSVNRTSPNGVPQLSLEASTVGSPYSNETIQANYTVTVVGAAAVPEPSSLSLCGIAGLAGLGIARVRRRRRSS